MENLRSSGVQIYQGLDGYIKSMELRVGDDVKEIRQIINGAEVSKFHKATDYLVKDVIKQRVEKKIKLKNLISFGDDRLEIERSSINTLKEARVMPKNIKSSLMIAIFNNTVTITTLNVTNSVTVVLYDSLVTKTFINLFDLIWSISKKV